VPVSTNPALCGNEKIDGNEQCDLGSTKNGLVCNPKYGDSCTYCTNTCIIETVEAAQRCGNGVVDKDADNNWLEACDYMLDSNGNQVTVSTHREQGDVGDLSCTAEGYDKGSYQCSNNCQLLVNNCIACNMGDNLPIPKLGIINPMFNNGNALYTDNNPYVALLKENPDFNNYWVYGVWRKISYNGSIPINSSEQQTLIVDNEGSFLSNGKGLETSNQCKYKLLFNYKFLNNGAKPDSIVSSGLGDLFDYPVNNESGIVKNDVIMSPALPSGQVRVVVRSDIEANDGYDFVGNFMYDKFNISQNIKFNNITTSNLCGSVEKNSQNYFLPSSNCTVYGDFLAGRNFAWVHPIIKSETTQIQAYTFDFTKDSFPTNDAIGFYVTSPNDHINRRLSDEVWVDVYLPKITKDVPEYSIYKPDYTFKISDAVVSNAPGASYWHVFNFYVFTDNQFIIQPIGQNIPFVGISSPGHYLINQPDIPANYAGAIVTDECKMRANIPNTQPCE
jgi:hypothetical protein